MTTQPLAVQLYTLRDQIATNYVRTLRAVAELGYRAVEVVTLGNLTAQELRAELDSQGLSVAGIHVALSRLEQNLDAVLSEARTLGAQYIVCPWLPPERRTDADSYRSLARSLNQIGARCKAAGFQLCYHNHDFEFAPVDGTTGFDILFATTDPGLLRAELDVYWVAFAGLDPVELLRKMGNRVALVHLKDMADDAARSFAEVGHGTLDFPAILAACDDVGVEWLIVEQDRTTRPPLESVGMSLSYLRSLGRE